MCLYCSNEFEIKQRFRFQHSKSPNNYILWLKSFSMFSLLFLAIMFALISISGHLCGFSQSFHASSLFRASGSSRSIGGGDVNTSTFLLGPCVKYPAVGVTPTNLKKKNR